MPLEVRFIEPPVRVSFPPTEAELAVLRQRAFRASQRYVIPLEEGRVDITPPGVTNDSYFAESHENGGIVFVRRGHWSERFLETVGSFIPGLKGKMPANVEIISLPATDVVPMGRRVPQYIDDMPMPSIYRGNFPTPDGYRMEVSQVVVAPF